MTHKRPFLVEMLGEAGLRVAPDLAATLRQALAAHDAITIAPQAITGADITTIQLLLAARKQAVAAGKSLSLTTPPTGVLADLLLATGCIDADGRSLTGDGDFWTPRTDPSEGIPA